MKRLLTFVIFSCAILTSIGCQESKEERAGRNGRAGKLKVQSVYSIEGTDQYVKYLIRSHDGISHWNDCTFWIIDKRGKFNVGDKVQLVVVDPDQGTEPKPVNKEDK